MPCTKIFVKYNAVYALIGHAGSSQNQIQSYNLIILILMSNDFPTMGILMEQVEPQIGHVKSHGTNPSSLRLAANLEAAFKSLAKVKVTSAV